MEVNVWRQHDSKNPTLKQAETAALRTNVISLRTLLRVSFCHRLPLNLLRLRNFNLTMLFSR